MGISRFIQKSTSFLFSEKTREVGEKVVVWLAVVSFMIHLTVIASVQSDLIQVVDAYERHSLPREAE